ncbi:helix-turn-helix transcriptional regulator [Acetobacter aceti]|uniref:helix-turn-helix transcriptional regulator n=1 Tax=Acetobacter aceti TaxID=435 RepID=UPI000C07A82A
MPRYTLIFKVIIGLYVFSEVMMAENLLTIAQVCERVSMSASHIRKRIKLGKFPAATHRLSTRMVRWSESSINEWIEKTHEQKKH